MNHTRLWAAAVIIALVVIVGFALSVPHTRDVAQAPSSQNKETGVPLVTLHDAFKKGIHTITGSIDAPNACTVVTAQATFLNDASSTERILVALSMPEDTGVCLQVPMRMNFSATVSAPANVPLTATVNGSVATTTVS
ncbi:MAG: hypothetical protein Q8P16_00470 [bacterium]|nr:hypothetical protein [bacterium]